MRLHFTEPYLLNPVHKITINLVGIGGTGGQVLNSLVRMNEALIGLGHPGLHVYAYDSDIVTESNIGRQLFTHQDIGMNKAVVSVTRVNRYMGYDWEAIPSKFNANNPANILITCIDTAAGRLEIKDDIMELTSTTIPHRKMYYWLDFGNSKKTGQFVLGTLKPISQPKSDYETVDVLKTVVDHFGKSLKKKQVDDGPSCSIAQALGKQDLFINSTLANLGCNLLWKLFREGNIKHCGGYLNLDSLTVNPIKL